MTVVYLPKTPLERVCVYTYIEYQLVMVDYKTNLPSEVSTGEDLVVIFSLARLTGDVTGCIIRKPR